MSSDEDYGPALPPGFQNKNNKDTSSEEDDTYGPALPSKSASIKHQGPVGPKLPKHMSKDSSDSDPDSSSGSSDNEAGSSKRQKIIGPSVPQNISKEHLNRLSHTSEKEDSHCIGPVLPSHLKHLENTFNEEQEAHDSYSGEEDEIGPSLRLQATGKETTSASEFDLRAQKMHERLTGQDKETEVPTTRENWMTELPSAIGNQFGLANRNFRKNDAAEMDCSWTDTPLEKEKKEKEGTISKRKRKPDLYVPTEKDKKTAKEIDEFNKVHRPDSLMAMHEKKLKKKMKKEKKKKKKKDNKTEERRPFDRDVDLQVNKLDDARRKAIIKRSSELNSRFKTGGMGTSFL